MIFSRFPVAVRLFDQIRSPLVFNGYALVLGSGAASVLGVVYWVLAARFYPAEVVGVDTAVLSAMFFLANVAQLNLVHALNRFVPLAGRGTMRLVLGAYLVSILLALGVSIIFLFGLNLWTPALSALTSSPGSAVWFVVATIGWCIFTLQDGVLVGLRQAKWVPLSTIAYATIKLGLIALFATMFPAHGVLMSWTMPVLVLVLPMNAFIFFRLIPNHVRATEHHSQAITLRAIARFVAGNYLSSFIWMATTTLLPIIILEKLGAISSAHFYLAWNIAYALYFVSTNMGMSLVTEASRDEENLNYYSYQTLKQTLRLIVPAVIVIFIGAPYLLRLYGANYAANDVTLLRLLCLSAIPYVFVLIYISMARVKREILKILFVYTALCVAVLLCANVFIGIFGLEGVGFAWVIGQSLGVGALLATDLRQAWLPYVRVPGYLRPLLGGFRTMATRLLRRRMYRTRTKDALTLVSRQFSGEGEPNSAWRAVRPLPNSGEISVMTLAPAGHPERAVLKIPVAHDARERLTRSTRALSSLHQELQSHELSGLLPRVLDARLSEPNPYIVESLLPGVQAEGLLRDSARRRSTLEDAVKTITGLHEHTAQVVTVDDQLLELWIDEPVRKICVRAGKDTPNVHRLTRLAEELKEALLGQLVTTSWIHGDYSPHNILFDKDGSRVTGIVDWERAGPRELPALDIVHLLLATRMLVERKELGDVVYSLLTTQSLSAFERALIYTDTMVAAPAVPEPRVLVLLTWLRHVASSSAHQYNNPFWLGKNVTHVLSCAKDGPR